MKHPVNSKKANLNLVGRRRSVSAESAEKWRIDVNDRYNKVVTTVMSLATGSLLLPVLFLREFLGIPKEKALAPFLNDAAYLAWFCLGFSILFGLIYSWLSVKWIKRAWGQEMMLSDSSLESILNVTFVGMGLLFVFGVAASVWFFVTLHVPS